MGFIPLPKSMLCNKYMASTKSTASTTISSGDFVKIDGKGIALVKQQECRDGAVMYIVHVCG